MSTFNAGAIEARLTLDRRPFNKEMKAAQAQARRFEARKINPELRLKGHDQLLEVEAILQSIDREKLELFLDVDGMEDLLALGVLVENLDGRDIDLSVDVDGWGELAAVGTMVETLDGRDIDIDIDVNGGEAAAAAMANHVTGFSRMQALVTAILVLLPLVPPAVASVTAGIVGLASALTGAFGALGVVGLAVLPTAKNMMDLTEELDKQKTRLSTLKPGTEAYAKQQEKIKNLQKELNNEFGAASSGLAVMKDAWAAFTTATQGPAQQIIGDFFRMLATILPRLVPVFEAAAPVVSAVFDSITKFAQGPEMDRVIAFFTDFGSDQLGNLFAILGNLTLFFGRLFEAFAPFADWFMDALVDMTAAWAEWADNLSQSDGFQQFIEYVMEEGPRVWELIKEIVDALINIGVALAPLGEVTLDAFIAFFDYISEMDPSILGAIITGLGFATVAVLGVTAAIAAFNFVMALNPFVLLAIAVTALVAALLYLWNTNDGFRDAVISAWNAIMDFIRPAIEWFTDTAMPAFGAAWDWVVGRVQAFWQQVEPIVTQFNSTVASVMVFIATLVQTSWNVITSVISFAWDMITGRTTGATSQIGTVVSTAFNYIRTVITGIMGVIRAIITTAWNIIRTVVVTALRVVQQVVRAATAALKGDWTGAWNAIKVVPGIVFNAILSVIRSAINGVISIVRAGMNLTRSTFSAAWRLIQSVFRAAVAVLQGAVRNVMQGIVRAVSGAPSLLYNAGRAIIQGLVNGIRNMAGAVTGAVRGVLSAARNLLPFSPAKEGPFSGKGWTLYSGMAIIDALATGVRSQKDNLRRSVLEVLDDAKPGDDPFGLNNFGPGGPGQGPAFAFAGPQVRDIHVKVETHNPLPERSSDTAIREVTRLGALGVFEG